MPLRPGDPPLKNWSRQETRRVWSVVGVVAAVAAVAAIAWGNVLPLLALVVLVAPIQFFVYFWWRRNAPTPEDEPWKQYQRKQKD